MGNVIRTTFNSASTRIGVLNFVVVASSAGRRSEANMSVGDSQTPFHIDFRFAGAGPATAEFGNAGSGVPLADFSELTFVVFQFVASGDVVIDSFEII
jgi:hypothetical protein